MFINADPNANLSFGRGLWTDPGLYTAQLKSFVNSGDWLIDLSPCLIVTPLYSLFLLLPFLFSQSLLMVKIFNLCLFLGSIIFLQKKHRKLRPILLLFVMIFAFQFQIFEFLHVGLVETLVSAFFLVLFSVSVQKVENKKWYKSKELFASVLSTIIFLLKI